MKGTLAYNAASVVGTGLGTIFRYFSYKKWVFLAGRPGAAVAAGEAAVSGLSTPRIRPRKRPCGVRPGRGPAG